MGDYGIAIERNSEIISKPAKSAAKQSVITNEIYIYIQIYIVYFAPFQTDTQVTVLLR